VTDYQKMDPEVKALWVEALRSGNFKQGRNLLRSMDDSYCCLGVLCELAHQAGVIPAPEPSTKAGGDPIYYQYQDRTGFPPDDVKEWAGLSRNVSGDINPEIGELTRMNDAKRATFGEIANWIEREL
jgi:hypothetical protein